jgi:endonuclease/exonuclease/phosphatase family metal-dependent hydrolase
MFFTRLLPETTKVTMTSGHQATHRFFCRLATVFLLSVLPVPLLALNPSAGDFSKDDSRHVRVMSWNTARNFMDVASTDDEYQRILNVLKPDVIVFNEIVNTITAAQLQTRLNSVLPLGSGRTWTVKTGLTDGFIYNALASSTTQSLQITDTTPASEVRGVTAALVDLPNATYSYDLYVMGVHLKAYAGGTNTTRRQTACDALAKWFGDIRTSGGSINLPSYTPALVMGDFNFVDTEPQQPEITVRTGDIINNATYGADIKGDWDVTDLTDVTPRDPYTNDADTYPTGTTNPTSRIDRIYYTDSAMRVANKFVFNTRTMSSAQRTAAGVNSADCETASDHLPVIADLVVLPVPVGLSAFSAE